jgi:hypothetical protein
VTGNTKRRIGGVAITGLVIAGVIGVTSMSASGQTPTPATGPVFQPYGTLTVELTGSGAAYVLVRAGVEDREPIQTSQPCATVAPGSGNYLVLSPNPGSATSDTVQIRNDAFGVNTGGTSCGSSSAAVISGGERLKIDLGPGLPTDVYAKSADLLVTQVKKGNLQYALGTGALSPEISITQSPQTVEIDPVINTNADLFRSITITSTSRKDNQGLSVANGTSFELVTLDPDFDVAVNCGESVAATVASGDVASSAIYERLDNKLPENTCEEVGVRVEIQDGDELPASETEARVFWNNSFAGVNGGSDQSVQAYFTIVWAGTTDVNDLTRDIDYDADGTALPEAMLWCDGYIDGIPNLPTTTNDGGIDVNPLPLVDDIRAPWCLVQDDRILEATGIVQTQKLFGSGDPWAR